MKTIIIAIIFITTAAFADVEITYANWRGLPVVINGGITKWTLPIGQGEITLPEGDYTARTVDTEPGQDFTIASTILGAYRLHLWEQPGTNTVALFLDNKESNRTWFLEGFSLGLTFFGFALILRSVRKITNHSVEL